MVLPAVSGQPVDAADMNAKRNIADAIFESDLDSGVTAKLNGSINADRIVDGNANKAYTAAEKTKLAGLGSGGGTAASSTVAGVVELATNAETASGAATGSSGPLVVTPAGLSSVTSGLLTQTTADGRYDAAGAAAAVSSSVTTALAAKAPLVSPAFTGTPTVNGSPLGSGGGTIGTGPGQLVARGSDGLVQKTDLPALTVNTPLVYNDTAGTLSLPATAAAQALLNIPTPTAVGQTLVVTALSPLTFGWASGSGAGAAFDPGSIANLAHYWVADNAAGADGAAVTSVPNSVAGGPALTQVTTARQPIVKVGVANGHRVIRFTPGADASTDDGLDATITSLAQPVTWFVVYNINTRTADAEQQIFQSGHELSYLGSPSVPQVYAGTSLAAFTGATPQALGLSVVQISGGNVTYRRNGGAGTTIAAGTATTGTALTVARHTANGRGLSGDIAGIGVYSRALTTAEINTLGAGLASTFGFTWTTAT